jgi:aldose 1-epimerase
MAVSTTEPGLQLHTGNVLTGGFVGTGGRNYRQSDGVCLETQHFPDWPNQPGFPQAVVDPAEPYRSSTTFEFSLAKQ